MPNIVDKHSGLPLGLWDEVELAIEKDGRCGHYISRVVDVISDGIVLIEPIWSRGDKFQLSEIIADVQFVKSDALYRFKARVRSFHDEYIKRCLLYEISDISRVQRRQYSRINYATSLKYKIIGGTEDVAVNNNWADSISANLSAGGMLFEVDNRMKKDDLLLLRVNNIETLNIPGTIVARCRRLIPSDKNALAGVEFIIREKRSDAAIANNYNLPANINGDFDAGAQNRLARFVFQEQVREYNKRMVK
jgi:c-di-GMP-binding flagellar brake protein YcgR